MLVLWHERCHGDNALIREYVRFVIAHSAMRQSGDARRVGRRSTGRIQAQALRRDDVTFISPATSAETRKTGKLLSVPAYVGAQAVEFLLHHLVAFTDPAFQA